MADAMVELVGVCIFSPMIAFFSPTMCLFFATLPHHLCLAQASPCVGIQFPAPFTAARDQISAPLNLYPGECAFFQSNLSIDSIPGPPVSLSQPSLVPQRTLTLTAQDRPMASWQMMVSRCLTLYNDAKFLLRSP